MDNSLLCGMLGALTGKDVVFSKEEFQQKFPTGRTLTRWDSAVDEIFHFPHYLAGNKDLPAEPESHEVIFIKKFTGGVLQLAYDPKERVGALKRRIEVKEWIPAADQLLKCSSFLEDDERTLGDYGIPAGVTLSLSLRLLGGDPSLVFLFPVDLLDDRFHFDFRSITDLNITFFRGRNFRYERPCSWYRFAVKVEGRYENDQWLGELEDEPESRTQASPDEWPVAYHGTGHGAASAIAKDGFDMNKEQRHVHGHGVYLTPNVHVAEFYAKQKQFEVGEGKEKKNYKLVLQVRVNPDVIKKQAAPPRFGPDAEYWIIPSDDENRPFNPDDIRPYGFCLKEV